MAFKFHYRTIDGYRILPPKFREIVLPKDERSPTEKYLSQVDTLINDTQSRVAPALPDDLVSLVFGNQTVTSELGTHQLAELIQERRALADRQIKDVQERLEELRRRRPFQPAYATGDSQLTEIERQMFDLERQQRALELALWKDTQELRATLVTQRREQDLTGRRLRHLMGVGYGAV